jgi:hypothetical protein
LSNTLNLNSSSQGLFYCDAMTTSSTKKSNLTPLSTCLLILGFLEFVFVYLLHDKKALTDSIYSYYQTEYYNHISRGEIPWIHFRFEYPPLAGFVLLFPALVSGLSVLWVSILRGFSTLVISLLTLRFLGRCDRVPSKIQDSSIGH